VAIVMRCHCHFSHPPGNCLLILLTEILGHARLSFFFAYGLLSTYVTLHFKEIRVSRKIKVYTSVSNFVPNSTLRNLATARRLSVSAI